MVVLTSEIDIINYMRERVFKNKNNFYAIKLTGRGFFWFNGPLRQYLSPYRAVSQGEGERREK